MSQFHHSKQLNFFLVAMVLLFGTIASKVFLLDSKQIKFERVEAGVQNLIPENHDFKQVGAGLKSSLQE